MPAQDDVDLHPEAQQGDIVVTLRGGVASLSASWTTTVSSSKQVASGVVRLTAVGK